MPFYFHFIANLLENVGRANSSDPPFEVITAEKIKNLKFKKGIYALF